MTQISSLHSRHIALPISLLVGGFLLAHTINAFVGEALYIVPKRHPESSGSESARPVLSQPTQLAEDIRTSGLFLLPPTPLGTTVQDGGVGVPLRASLGIAAKLKLMGVVLGDHRGVFAIMEELTSRKQALYRLHDHIPDVGEVAEIRRDGVVIRQGDLEELLELGPSDKPATASPGRVASASSGLGHSVRRIIDRREVETAMNDLPKLLSQARAVPHMVNGTVNGFRLEYIAPASFYERIGVQNGDILQRVNGVDIRDPSTMLTLLQQLKNERIVRLDLVRNNRPSTVTYELR